jgi:hypothetical protein
MTFSEQSYRGSISLSVWAESLAAAAREGLCYERWWEARLPIQEIRRQYCEEQIEKGNRALAVLESFKLRENSSCQVY